MSSKKQDRLVQNKIGAKRNASTSDLQTNKTTLLWLLGIIILTYIAFIPALKNGFTNWDDNVYIPENGLIKSLSMENIKKIFEFKNHVSLNYHPITILSLAIDYHISGFNPKVFHLTNILFHLLNTALVFWFVFLLSERKIMVAAITAILFGIHPMHVESVGWISERKDVLYVFFFLAALIVYLKYLQKEGTQKLIFYALLILLFLLSVLSKSMAIVLPVVMLLIDYYTGRKFDKNVILEKLPFFALSLFFGLLAVKIQSNGAIANFETFTIFQRICFASYGTINYIFKLFLPIHLSCFYPYPNLINNHLPIIFYIAPLIVMGLFGSAIYLIRKNKVLVFGFFYFMVTVVMVLQLISVGKAIMADRYTYLSYIGLFFIIAMGYQWFLSSTEKKYAVFKKLSTLLLGAILIFFFYITFQRCKVWKNSDVLWTDAIQKYPNNETGYTNRGSYLVNEKAYDVDKKDVGPVDYDRALADFTTSIKINLPDAKVFINRANIYGLKNQFDLALKDYSKAIELDKKNAQTFFNRAITYSMMKQFDKAIEDYTTALAMDSTLTMARQSRAFAYIDNGNYDKAIADLDELIHLDSNNFDYYFRKGIVHIKMGNNLAGLEDNTIAIKLNPNSADAYFNKSIANKGLGKYKDALDDALKAKSLGYVVDVNYLNDLRKK